MNLFTIVCPYCRKRIPLSSIRCPECRAVIPHECGEYERKRIFLFAGAGILFVLIVIPILALWLFIA